MVTAAYLARLAAGRVPVASPPTMLMSRSSSRTRKIAAKATSDSEVPAVGGLEQRGGAVADTDPLIPERIARNCFSSYPDSFVA